MATFKHISLQQVLCIVFATPLVLSKPVFQCRPKVGNTGDVQSVKVLVKEFHQGMSNIYSYGVKQVSKVTHSLDSNGTAKMIHSKHSAFAVFYGKQVCVSVKKITVLDENGKNETRTEQCEYKCFDVNETAVMKTKVEEGGKVWKGSGRLLCCLWSSETWLEFSIEKPSYKCVSCQGKRCRDNSTSLSTCSAGEGCFSMVFKLQKGNESTVYPVKGCTDHAIMYSRKCWGGCRNISVSYEMCIDCCYGDGCNEDKKENATMMPTTFATRPSKLLRRGDSWNALPDFKLLLFLLLLVLGSVNLF